MAFDPQALLDLPPIVTRQKINPFKVMLYAVAIGADELPFVYEDGLQVMPSMAVTMTYPGFIWRDPALRVSWQKILHVETGLTIHRPLPTTGELVGTTTFEAVYDKGADKGAMVLQRREIALEDGTPLATVRNTTYLRGDGGQGGAVREGFAETQPAPHPVPDREPDTAVAISTREDQALLYRLASGDMNPLHADPAVAHGAGFDRPILHGLATYGIACRAVMRALAGNDPACVRRLDARFSAPVYPGETILTTIWRETDRTAVFQARAIPASGEGHAGRVVLNNGYVEFQ